MMRLDRMNNEHFSILDWKGIVRGSAESIHGAIQRAVELSLTGALSIRGEYTSDGSHQGVARGRLVARRDSTTAGKWLIG